MTRRLSSISLGSWIEEVNNEHSMTSASEIHTTLMELMVTLPSICLSGVWLSPWSTLNFEHFEHVQEQSSVQSQPACKTQCY